MVKSFYKCDFFSHWLKYQMILAGKVEHPRKSVCLFFFFKNLFLRKYFFGGIGISCEDFVYI